MIDFIVKYQQGFLLVLILGIFILCYVLYTYVTFNNQRKQILKLQNNLMEGDEVILSSGFYVTIKKIEDQTAWVWMDEKTTAKINRYSITAKKQSTDSN